MSTWILLDVLFIVKRFWNYNCKINQSKITKCVPQRLQRTIPNGRATQVPERNGSRWERNLAQTPTACALSTSLLETTALHWSHENHLSQLSMHWSQSWLSIKGLWCCWNCQSQPLLKKLYVFLEYGNKAYNYFYFIFIFFALKTLVNRFLKCPQMYN